MSILTASRPRARSERARVDSAVPSPANTTRMRAPASTPLWAPSAAAGGSGAPAPPAGAADVPPSTWR
eukprot:1836967-Pleurochrysis_carterae.AAC.1